MVCKYGGGCGYVSFSRECIVLLYHCCMLLDRIAIRIMYAGNT